MPDYLAQASLATDSGLPEDVVINTFAFNQVAETDLPDVAQAVEDFYNAIPSGTDRIGSAFTVALANFLSPVLSVTASACQVRFYEITDPFGVVNLGSPVYAEAWTLGAPAGGSTAIPSEVALVLTLEAAGREDAPVETATTRPKQRYTGRVYLGPLNNNAVVVTSGTARPSNPLQDVAVQAAIDMASDLRAINPASDFGVWSRADGIVRNLGHASVDNSFDTQRSRGEASTARRRIAVP